MKNDGSQFESESLVSNPDVEFGRKLDREEFERLATGTKIQGLSWSANTITLEMENETVFTIEISPSNDLDVSVSAASVQTRIVLVNDHERPLASVIEQRIRCVRQLYALFFISEAPLIGGYELIPIAAVRLEPSPGDDIEDMVPISLEIRSAGMGTFWIDLFANLKNTPSAVIRKACTASLFAVSLISKRGWILLERILEAKTLQIQLDTIDKASKLNNDAADADARRKREQIEIDMKAKREAVEIAGLELNKTLTALRALDELVKQKPAPDDRAILAEEVNVLKRSLLRNIKGMFGDQSEEFLPFLPVIPAKDQSQDTTKPS